MLANNSAMPVTPARPHGHEHSLQISSPFSNYFTDEARSEEDTPSASSNIQQLFVRMQNLQSQLLREHQNERDEDSEAIRIVGAKLSEIELELSSLHSQTRLPVELEDDTIYDTASPSDRLQSNRHSSHAPYLDNSSTDIRSEPVTIEQFRAERDWFILRMQELVNGLHSAQAEFSERFAEVRQLNARHNAEIEERETRLEHLRSENETLASEAGFGYSELLFLKLQMKSLEVDVDTLRDDFDTADTADSRSRRAKKNRILAEMDRWRADWQDVRGRAKRRRSRHGIQSELSDSDSQDEHSPAGDDVDWHLETIKDGGRRVTSLTIKRMDGNDDTSPVESSIHHRLADSTLGESLYDNMDRSDRLDASVVLGALPVPTSRSSYSQGTEKEVDQDLLQDIMASNEIPLVQQDATSSDEDCAITTSSEGSDVEADGNDAKGHGMAILDMSASSKTAWQELWESLASFSGMGEDRIEK